MYSATDVADFIIHYGQKKKYDISNDRLQLFLYFVQKDYALTGSKCFGEEVNPGENGPVVPSVNEKYREYADKTIPNPEKVPEIEKNDQIEIQAVVDKYEWFSTDFLQFHAQNEMGQQQPADSEQIQF